MRKMKGLIIWFMVIFLVIGLGFAFPLNADGKVTAKSWLSVTPAGPSSTKHIEIDSETTKLEVQIIYLHKRFLLSVSGRNAEDILIVSYFRYKEHDEKEFHSQLIKYRVIDFNFSDGVLHHLKIVIPVPDFYHEKALKKGHYGPYPELLLFGGNIRIKFGRVLIRGVEAYKYYVD